jgi:hypothetical protein
MRLPRPTELEAKIRSAANLAADHKRGPVPRPPEQRFSEQFAVEPNTGCWLWLGFLHNGYGQIRVGDRVVKAHKTKARRRDATS